MTKKELKARVRELEIENARLRGENTALRRPTTPGGPVQVGDVPPWRPGLPQVWCGTDTGGNIKHIDDFPRVVQINRHIA